MLISTTMFNTARTVCGFCLCFLRMHPYNMQIIIMMMMMMMMIIIIIIIIIIIGKCVRLKFCICY